jgi:uncharacterized membrane protein YbhN (UPF0104 family)
MKNFRKRAIQTARIVIVIALLIPLAYSIYKRWLDVQITLLTAHWSSVIIGLILLMLAQPIMGLISWIVLQQLKQNFSYLKIATIYFISQAAKYLPGGIWAFPGRVVAYQAIGVERSASVVSMVREVSVLFLGAAIVGLGGLLNGFLISDWVRYAIVAGVGICVLAVTLLQLPGTWKILSKFRWLSTVNLADTQVEASRRSLRWLPISLLTSIAFWLLVGVAFQQVALGIASNTVRIPWFQAASIFALAWSAGFVIIFVPAGIGVRESVLSVLLLSYMPASDALSIALIARFWWTLAEAFFIVLAAIKVAGEKTEQLVRNR